ATPKSSSEIIPFLTSAVNRHKSEVPIFFPLYFPVNIGPPDTTSVGKLTLAAPITKDGVVLSHPHNKITPSSGLALIDSSTSILARFLNNMVVGFIKVSPNDITGNSNGNPPASKTPFLTDSAKSLKCALHGVSSDHVLQIPITGFPSNMSAGIP